MRAFLTACILNLILTPVLRANDAAVRGIGGSIQAMDEHPSVVMVSESILIKVHPRYADVRCTFVFQNEGAPVRVKVGFPERGWGVAGHPQFEWFKATVDGKPARVTVTPWESNGMQSRWRVKTISFGRNQRRVVKNFYRSRGGEITDGIHTFDYVLQTGKSWKGPIGSADVVLDISGIHDNQTLVPYPEGYTRQGNLLKWHFSNFEPEDKDNISLRFATGFSAFVVDGKRMTPYRLGLYGAAYRPRIELVPSCTESSVML